MPELPEVETVRKKLSHATKNKTISKVSIFYPKMIRNVDAESFTQQLLNKTITSFTRRGKHLIFIVDDSLALISHLRMEGKYSFHPTQTEPSKHDHVIFHFSDGSTLHYHDVRKFGTMDLVSLSDVDTFKSIKELGPEPIDPSLTGDYLHSITTKKSSSIKNILLNQSVIAGLGNIYVDEVLFSSNIHPERIGTSLSKEECSSICHSSKKIIELAIEKGGSTIRSYNSLGESGDMQHSHQVYGKNGQPCRRCSTLIKKIKISGRGTHFCPSCQPLKQTKL